MLALGFSTLCPELAPTAHKFLGATEFNLKHSARPRRATKAKPFQSRVDFVQRLFAKVGDAQQVFAFTVQQVVDRKNSAFFKAVGGTYGQTNFGRAHLKTFLHSLIRQLSLIERYTCARHGGVLPFAIELHDKKIERVRVRSFQIDEQGPDSRTGWEYTNSQAIDASKSEKNAIFFTRFFTRCFTRMRASIGERPSEA